MSSPNSTDRQHNQIQHTQIQQTARYFSTAALCRGLASAVCLFVRRRLRYALGRSGRTWTIVRISRSTIRVIGGCPLPHHRDGGHGAYTDPDDAPTHEWDLWAQLCLVLCRPWLTLSPLSKKGA